MARCVQRRLSAKSQRRIIAQHLVLEFAQEGTWVEANFTSEVLPGSVESRKRVAPAAGSIQGQHELSDEPLPQRVLSDQLIDLGRQLRMAPECEVAIELVLGCREPLLLEPFRVANKPCTQWCGICERSTTPQLKGFAEKLRGGREIARGRMVPALGS